MKRREFLSSAGARATLPVLPLPAMAVPVATAPANAAMVGWVALFARAKGRPTPALIQKWMGVGAAQADALMGELVKRNIVQFPVAGVSASVQSMYPRGRIPGASDVPSQILRKASDAFDALL